jgi:hypothetical protein
VNGDTVKVDQAARDASQQFRAIIDSNLTEALTRLQQAGDVLAAPEHWSGRLAGEFEQIWSQVKGDFQRTIQGLQELQQHAEKILEDITQAGGG